MQNYIQKSNAKMQTFRRVAMAARVAGQLGPWVKSAWVNSPDSTWPGVFLEHSAIYMIYGLFCMIFWTKSQMNIKQLLSNIAIKLLIDQIEGELATWLKVMAVLYLMKV